MKKIVSTVLALFLIFFVTDLFAEDVTKTLTFEWDQTDTTNLKDWRLYWGDAQGGPYDTAPVAVIPYDSTQTGPTYSSPASATVTGSPATTVTKYFVLVACGDIPQPDGTTDYQCSTNSNEVSHDFWIPAGKFSVPVNFSIKATP